MLNIAITTILLLFVLGIFLWWKLAGRFDIFKWQIKDIKPNKNIKGLGYYGTVRDQLHETKDHISLHWSAPFDGNTTERVTNVIMANQPTIWDLDDIFWNKSKGKPYTLRGGALERLEDLKKKFEAVGILDNILGFTIIDEPNGKVYPGDIPIAVASVREIFPDKKLVVIYHKDGDIVYPELFDIVGRDHYSKWNWALSKVYKPLQKTLKPHQSLLLVPGAADVRYPNATLSKWLKWANKQNRDVYIIGFMWDYPDSSDKRFKGIKHKPNLRKQYEIIGKNILN